MALQQFANSILGGRRRSSNKASRDRDASAPPRVSQPTDASLQVTNGDKTDKKPEPPKIVPVSATSEIRSSWLNLSDKTEIQKGLDPPFSKKYKASVSDVSPPEAPEVLEKLEEIRRPMSGSFLYKRQETLTDAKLRLSKNAANPLELARRTANNVDSTRPTVQSKVAKYQNVTAAPQAKVLPTIRKEPETPTASIAPTWNAPKVVDSPATKLKATVSQWGFNNKTQQKTSKTFVFGRKKTPPNTQNTSTVPPQARRKSSIPSPTSDVSSKAPEDPYSDINTPIATKQVDSVQPDISSPAVATSKPASSAVENFLKHESTIVKQDDCEQCGSSRRSQLENVTNEISSALTSSKLSTDASDTEAMSQILIATEKLLESTSKFDFEKFAQLSSDDFTCFQPSTHGNLLKGLDFHKFYFDSGIISAKSVRTKLINPHVQLISTNVALIAYNLISQTIDKDGLVKLEHSQESRVWCRSDKNSNWTCVHLHKSVASNA